MLYSILPAAVALYFLIAGLVVQFMFSNHQSHFAFIILCITTFSWQLTWAILFQVNDPELADILIKIGYLFIFFLPTSIYHFLVNISHSRREIHYVYLSYAIACLLAILLFTTDLVISGHYQYYFGFYPKAGQLHIIHVLQTAIVTLRGLYLVYKKQRESSGLFKSQLRYCLLSLLIYILAAVDYLCNYGIEFYPPGIFFITIGLSVFLYALLKMELMTSFHQVFTQVHDKGVNLLKSLAENIAHELRTPLAIIQMDAKSAKSQSSPYLLDNIINTANHANFIINMLLTNLRSSIIDAADFKIYAAKDCINKALDTYPFQKDERKHIVYNNNIDFYFRGSDIMLIYIIYNLISNALYFIAKAEKGNIEIWLEHSDNINLIHFRDTGSGIPEDELQHVFNDFYSSKPEGVGNGLGLGFCGRVMNSFGGSIEVSSSENKFTHFILSFPGIDRQ